MVSAFAGVKRSRIILIGETTAPAMRRRGRPSGIGPDQPSPLFRGLPGTQRWRGPAAVAGSCACTNRIDRLGQSVGGASCCARSAPGQGMLSSCCSRSRHAHRPAGPAGIARARSVGSRRAAPASIVARNRGRAPRGHDASPSARSKNPDQAGIVADPRPAGPPVGAAVAPHRRDVRQGTPSRVQTSG